jgi:hypothetical protein
MNLSQFSYASGALLPKAPPTVETSPPTPTFYTVLTVDEKKYLVTCMLSTTNNNPLTPPSTYKSQFVLATTPYNEPIPADFTVRMVATSTDFATSSCSEHQQSWKRRLAFENTRHFMQEGITICVHIINQLGAIVASGFMETFYKVPMTNTLTIEKLDVGGVKHLKLTTPTQEHANDCITIQTLVNKIKYGETVTFPLSAGPFALVKNNIVPFHLLAGNPSFDMIDCVVEFTTSILTQHGPSLKATPFWWNQNPNPLRNGKLTQCKNDTTGVYDCLLLEGEVSPFGFYETECEVTFHQGGNNYKTTFSLWESNTYKGDINRVLDLTQILGLNAFLTFYVEVAITGRSEYTLSTSKSTVVSFGSDANKLRLQDLPIVKSTVFTRLKQNYAIQQESKNVELTIQKDNDLGLFVSKILFTLFDETQEYLISQTETVLTFVPPVFQTPLYGPKKCEVTFNWYPSTMTEFDTAFTPDNKLTVESWVEIMPPENFKIADTSQLTSPLLPNVMCAFNNVWDSNGNPVGYELTFNTDAGSDYTDSYKIISFQKSIEFTTTNTKLHFTVNETTVNGMPGKTVKFSGECPNYATSQVTIKITREYHTLNRDTTTNEFTVSPTYILKPTLNITNLIVESRPVGENDAPIPNSNQIRFNLENVFHVSANDTLKSANVQIMRGLTSIGTTVYSWSGGTIPSIIYYDNNSVVAGMHYVKVALSTNTYQTELTLSKVFDVAPIWLAPTFFVNSIFEVNKYNVEVRYVNRTPSQTTLIKPATITDWSQNGQTWKKSFSASPVGTPTTLDFTYMKDGRHTIPTTLTVALRGAPYKEIINGKTRIYFNGYAYEDSVMYTNNSIQSGHYVLDIEELYCEFKVEPTSAYMLMLDTTFASIMLLNGHVVTSTSSVTELLTSTVRIPLALHIGYSTGEIQINESGTEPGFARVVDEVISDLVIPESGNQMMSITTIKYTGNLKIPSKCESICEIDIDSHKHIWFKFTMDASIAANAKMSTATIGILDGGGGGGSSSTLLTDSTAWLDVYGSSVPPSTEQIVSNYYQAKVVNNS